MAAVPVYLHGDTVNTVLNVARSRVKDRILTPQGFPGGSEPGRQFNEIGGGTALSTDVNPDGSLVLRTQVIFNSAWRKFQAYLAALGWRRLIGDDLIVASLPPNINPDTARTSWLSYNGFHDGTVLHPDIKLPLDFYAPLRVSERQSGVGRGFCEMTIALGGFARTFQRTTLNGKWEWRGDALYLPGATQTTDLLFRYVRFLPAFPDPNYFVAETPWFKQIVPVPACSSALAWYCCYEAVLSSEDGAEDILVKAQAEADEVFNNLQARADQRAGARRIPRGSHGRAR